MAVLKSQFAQLISAVDVVKNVTLRQEFMKLVVLLVLAATDEHGKLTDPRLDPRKMDRLTAFAEYTVRVR
jgi:hypothetical protein